MGSDKLSMRGGRRRKGERFDVNGRLSKRLQLEAIFFCPFENIPNTKTMKIQQYKKGKI
jgi:hypothetical protein